MRFLIEDDELQPVFLTNEREGQEGAPFYLVDPQGREYAPRDEVPAREQGGAGLRASTLVLNWLYGVEPLDGSARAAAHAYLQIEERRVQERVTRKARWSEAVTRLKVARVTHDREEWARAKEEVDAIREHRADDLLADLTEAERAVAALAPEVLIRLDKVGEAYDQARDTWTADLKSGDLPNEEAEERAVQERRDAWTRVAGVFYGKNSPARIGNAETRHCVQRLARVVRRLAHLAWRNELLAEHIAEALGDRGARYCLGF